MKPPEILIFFHIPKTGGSTMDYILQHCFPGPQHFYAHVGVPQSSLWVSRRDKIAAKYASLSSADRERMRCAMGVHFPMGIHTLFERPAKYFTILRHPVERAASQFFFMRTQSYVPIYPYIKDMTLEQYLDSGLGLDPFDHQVRMLSGAPELDADYNSDGRPIAATPVETRHLEMAKRNIEEHFIAAAPLEQFNSLVIFLKRLYGWPLRRTLFETRNVTEGRPRALLLEGATRRRLEDCNRYDLALYEWVKRRFAEQIAPFEPGLARERRRYEAVNGATHAIARSIPRPVARWVANLLLFTRLPYPRATPPR